MRYNNNWSYIFKNTYYFGVYVFMFCLCEINPNPYISSNDNSTIALKATDPGSNNGLFTLSRNSYFCDNYT